MIRELPCCGFELKIATSIKVGSKNALPQKGDALICYNCGSWFVYEGPKVRRFSEQDHKIFGDEAVKNMRRVTRLIKKRGRM